MKRLRRFRTNLKKIRVGDRVGYTRLFLLRHGVGPFDAPWRARGLVEAVWSDTAVVWWGEEAFADTFRVKDLERRQTPGLREFG